MQTFNGVEIKDVDPSFIESQFGIRITNNRNEDLPTVFPGISKTSCSCDKCSMKLNLDNLQICDLQSNSNDDSLMCCFCRNKINECCSNCETPDSISSQKYCNIEECSEYCLDSCSEYCLDHCLEFCSNHESNLKKVEKKICIVIKSLSCDHKFHFCCLKNWLPEKTICPVCAVEWKYKNITDTKIIIHYQDMVGEFECGDNLNLTNDIGTKFNLDMSKYKMTKNKNYVDEIKPGRYGLCTLDTHSGFNAFKLEFKLENNVQSTHVKYSTTIKELKEIVSGLFGILKGQFKLKFEDIELSSDFDNLNVFNLNIVPNSVLFVENCISNEYVVSMEEKFMILYPNCPETGDSIQSIITASIAWLPYPYFKNTTTQELSCFLSSLYILIKKVNMDEDQITRICDKFEKYLTDYEFHPAQISIAKTSLQNLLKLKDFYNKNRMVLVCTFYELIVRMQKESGLDKIQNVLLNSNVVCNLLFIPDDAEKINWKFALTSVKTNKLFNIFSPLVLINSVPPLLTMNEKLNVNVFTGKGKSVSLPIILFDPLNGKDVDVNAAELGKKVADRGDLLMVDDRIYDEGIMVCIDTSNSMGQCSDFAEDVLSKKDEEEKTKIEFYKILEIPRKKVPEDADLRQLKNAIIWFLTHPNFNDWSLRFDILDDIICFEQNDNLEIATMLSKYISIFAKLLRMETVNINNASYSYLDRKQEETKSDDPSEENDELILDWSNPKFDLNNIFKENDSTESCDENTIEEYKTEVPTEYKCPLSGKIMYEPIIASDGNTYEKSEITNWLASNNTSPVTGEEMKYTLLPNKTMQKIIDKWRKSNVINSEKQKENTVVIELPEPLKKIKFVFDDTTNIWDLKYHIFCVTGLNHLDYSLKNGYRSVNAQDLIKGTKGKITFVKLEQKNTEYTFEVQDTGSTMSINIPDNYTCKNLIYKQRICKYHKCSFWLNLVDDGDGFVRGLKLETSARLHTIQDSKLYQRKSNISHKNVNKTNYLSRLDVVKKLFDAFINRSIAYSFNTSIGLMSFSDENKLECSMTPFYESFRDKMEELSEKGGTSLYKSLKDAATNLVTWKKGDLEKRGGAKLRVVCLSDGKNTDSQSKTEVERIFLGNDVILDCIVIGKDFDSFLGTLSKKTGGYVFNPSTIRYSLAIMELETMISSKNREKCITRTGIIDEKSLPPIKKPIQLQEKRSLEIAQAVLSLDDTNKIIKRQLTEILKNPHPDIDVYINDSDFYFWKIILKGPESTPYKDGTWLLYVQFPTTYPNVVPNIRFVTPIKHCNVNNYGRICHSILDRNYTQNIKMTMILQCIYGLLLNPDVSDPLDTNLAALYYEATGQYEAQILEYVTKYALKTRDQWRKELI
jgi:ubiquitin-protein ligase